MLGCLVENKLTADFSIIEDNEDVSGQNLFMAFLKNVELDNSVKQINLISCENPPSFYFPKEQIKNDKITCHNFFSDPCGWNNPLAPKLDLHALTSDTTTLSDAAVFIDSLSVLVLHQGFFNTCRHLSVLKKFSKKVFCLVHGDLFSLEQLEDLSFFASAYIKLGNSSSAKSADEKICHMTYKKAGGKVIKYAEFFLVSDDLKVTCSVVEDKPTNPSDVKVDIENHSTFNVGLKIRVKEKKAKDKLVLPYLKTERENTCGEITYVPDNLEEDPDADLDI